MSSDAYASPRSPEEVAALLRAYEELQRENEALKRGQAELASANEELTRQVAWFRRQLFGAKSERRIVVAVGAQLTLGGLLRAEAAAAAAEIVVGAHRRRRRAPVEPAAEEPLRFDPSVPVEEI